MSETLPTVRVLRRTIAPGDAEAWRGVPAIDIAHFHPEGSDHRPRTQLQLAHSGDTIHARFSVEDRYVVARCTRLHDMVCRDSCVEMFIEPKAGRRSRGGYFNFELNAIGTMLVYHVRDETRTPEGLADYVPIESAVAERVAIRSMLSGPIVEEITEPVSWWLELHVPVSVLEAYVGAVSGLSGQVWRGNFFKCADASSRPHWASWSPVGEELNFHQSGRFGRVEFE